MPKFYIITVDGKEMPRIPFRNKKDKNRLLCLVGVKVEVYDTDTEARETVHAKGH